MALSIGDAHDIDRLVCTFIANPGHAVLMALATTQVQPIGAKMVQPPEFPRIVSEEPFDASAPS
jgi:hypothetical protein